MEHERMFGYGEMENGAGGENEYNDAAATTLKSEDEKEEARASSDNSGDLSPDRGPAAETSFNSDGNPRISVTKVSGVTHEIFDGEKVISLPNTEGTNTPIL